MLGWRSALSTRASCWACAWAQWPQLARRQASRAQRRALRRRAGAGSASPTTPAVWPPPKKGPLTMPSLPPQSPPGSTLTQTGALSARRLARNTAPKAPRPSWSSSWYRLASPGGGLQRGRRPERGGHQARGRSGHAAASPCVHKTARHALVHSLLIQQGAAKGRLAARLPRKRRRQRAVAAAAGAAYRLTVGGEAGWRGRCAGCHAGSAHVRRKHLPPCEGAHGAGAAAGAAAIGGA